ncbi:enhancer of mRNA-decapping protein 3 [Vairimorpha necatrix]|uniref:Enhancer of mRNA-decapping protein 3 n=1 Tax=Vairimorpha necatrix TaxID=6039 RepID=A0AAX4JES1_9MICR
MEDFVGCRMKFKIKDKEVFGVLKNWDSIREHLVIMSEDKEEKVDICDVSDLEICDLTADEEIEEDKIDKEEQDKIDKEEDKIDQTKHDQIKHDQINLDQINLDQINLNHTKESLSLVTYYELLNDCFTVWGPTREEFVASASLMIYKILRAKSPLKSVLIKLGTNFLLNCVGLSLGRILLVKDYSVKLEEGSENIETQKYKYIYNNNYIYNIISTKFICINFSEDHINHELVFGVNSLQPDCVNLLLGCDIKECKGREGYLIDCNISNKAYEKYNIKNIFHNETIIHKQN